MNEVANVCRVVPKPLRCVAGQGRFVVEAGTVIVAGQDCGELAQYLQSVLRPAMGFALEVCGSKREDGFIGIEIDDSLNAGPEGYKLSVSSDRVQIVGKTAAGAFYGIQSLRQLLPSEIYRNSTADGVEWFASAVEIEDEPRFGWRGLHLDVCRHFMPLEFLKKFIDLMAMHKMNTFHWHLTEDQGWRIEIKKYPKLTEVGAWRDETLIGHGLAPIEDQKYDGKKHGGYYTQDEVRQIVAYAKSRFVEVVPEIEMPGHAVAVLAAYPELSCHGEVEGVAKKWGIFDDVYCAGNEATFELLEGVLDEVVELFPNQYVHIGGDECPKKRWKECPKCQKRIADEGLANEDELQSYFITRMEKYLNGKGKTVIGWDEILEGGLAPNAVVMSWRGEKGGIAAAKAGHYVVMTPQEACYLDHYQGPKDQEPLAIGGNLTLDKVYAYDPVSKELDANEAKYILGVQGNIWTEYMPDPEHVEYMVYPRAVAIAEVGWSEQEDRDFNEFENRLVLDIERLDSLGVNYHK